jgi:hypothetical protein
MLRLGIELRLNPAFGQPSGFNSKPPPRPTSPQPAYRARSLPTACLFRPPAPPSASPRHTSIMSSTPARSCIPLPARCDGAGARPCNACVPFFSLPTALRILLPDLSCSAPPARTSPATSPPPPSTLWSRFQLSLLRVADLHASPTASAAVRACASMHYSTTARTPQPVLHALKLLRSKLLPTE